MKIYTRTGDNRTIGLFEGQRVSKDSLRVEAYGTVDELNAQLGLGLLASEGGQLREHIVKVQNDLFVLGTDLATPLGETKASAGVPRIAEADVSRLESWIYQAEGELMPMNSFILPSGSPGVISLHLARTVCRRSEPRVTTPEREEQVNEQARIYLNRLSDLLFVWARLVNQRLGVADQPWIAHGAITGGL
jgi:cob(I)alamin adenosyltransferase